MVPSFWEAVWPTGQRVGLAIRQSRVQARSGHLMDLFSVMCSVVASSNPRPCLSIANWLPPAIWGFKSCYVVFELLFFSKYLLIVKRFGSLRERRYISVYYYYYYYYYYTFVKRCFTNYFTTAVVFSHLPGSFTKLVRARKTFIFYFPNQKQRNYR